MTNESYSDLREHLRAPAGNGSEKAWSQVTSWVDGVARVETHGEADHQDSKAHGEGLQALGDGVVVGVHNSQDTHYQSCSTNGLQGGTQKGSQTVVIFSQTINS